MNMRWIYICSLLLFQHYQFVAQPIKGETRQGNFYRALFSDDILQLESQFMSLEQLHAKDTMAYSGALGMKKAGLLSTPREKLSFFKDGRRKLEQAITLDSGNVEYRFLRLIIQENAPPLMRYNGQLDEDKNFIRQKYTQLGSSLKSEIQKYSKTSKVLLTSDLE